MLLNVKKKKAADQHLAEEAAKGALRRDVIARFLGRRTGIIGLAIVIILLFITIFAPFLTPYEYDGQNYPKAYSYPSQEHIFGTDDFGRDTFTRILYGGRVSLLIAFCATLISATGGIVLGSVAGYFGRKIDLIISRIIDLIMSIPSLLIAIAVSVALGPGPLNTALAISLGGIASSARLMRATVMSVKANEFVEAAKSTGSHNLRIIFVHILPNCIAPLFIQIANGIGGAIMVIAGLSFIGLGVKPPTPEWGAMLNAGRAYIRDFWPMILFPAIFILLAILSFNLLGDALRDALDPRLKD